MGVNANFDVVNRLIDITKIPVTPAGQTIALSSIDVEIDLYSDGKEDWRTNASDERRHIFPFVTAETAGSAVPGGREEPAFFRLRNDLGWRLRPYDVDHELTLIGNIVPFDESLPIYAPRTGRTILIFQDGSQVANRSDGSTGYTETDRTRDNRIDATTQVINSNNP